MLLEIVGMDSECLGESSAGFSYGLFHIGKIQLDDIGAEFAKPVERSIDNLDYVAVTVEEKAANDPIPSRAAPAQSNFSLAVRTPSINAASSTLRVSGPT